MGQELECRMRLGRRVLEGKAYLETDHLLFRGEERVKILLKDLTGVTAAGGILTLDYEGGPAALELGKAAGKWAGKILHPPTRADKLGIKPGLTFRTIGEFEPDFLAELSALEKAAPKAKTDLLFVHAPARSTLAQVQKYATKLNPKGALWIVYPKGVPAIREVEVIQAGRDAGLKDIKVASFSATHTALKFTAPRPAVPGS
jgi:hypothetical protein